MNNLINTKNPIAAALLAAVGLSYVTPAAAQTAPPSEPPPVNYEGRDGNWFNPANWSSGRVPDLTDCLTLDGRDRVTIDPSLSAGGKPARGGDVHVIIIAALQMMPGTKFETSPAAQRLAASARVTMSASGWIGGDLQAEPGSTSTSGPEGGLWLDSSAVSKSRVNLIGGFRSQFGLGGRTPASIVRDAAGGLQLAAGYGYYSTLTADTVALGGHLWLNLHHDFKPARGDRFQIVNAARGSSGEFTGLPEGALAACTSDGLGLTISYKGGDGNDVELIAGDASSRACAAPTVQPLFQVNERLPITSPAIATTREHILLARQTP